MASRRLDVKSVVVTSNKTLAAVDAGVVQKVAEDALVFTLPSTAAGLKFVFEVAGDITNLPAGAGGNETVGFAISPAAADGISGGGLATPVVNKDLLYAKATSVVGERVALVGTGVAGVAAWVIEEISPAGWSREA